MNKTVIILIVSFIVLYVLQLIVRKYEINKLVKLSDNEKFDLYYKTIDGIPCYLTLSPFERESMRISGFIVEDKEDELNERMDLILKMRIKPKQKLVLANRAFYYYLDKKSAKQAKKMIDAIKNLAGEKAIHNLDIQYSILIKKESRYIDELTNRVNKFVENKDSLTQDQQFIIGTYEYLIGLQYSYKNDITNMMKYFNQAMEKVEGSPYYDDMNNIINSKKA